MRLNKISRKQKIFIGIILLSIIISIPPMIASWGTYFETPSTDDIFGSVWDKEFHITVMIPYCISLLVLFLSGYRCLAPSTLISLRLYHASIALSLFVIWTYGLTAIGLSGFIGKLIVISAALSVFIMPVNIILYLIGRNINNKHTGEIK